MFTVMNILKTEVYGKKYILKIVVYGKKYL